MKFACDKCHSHYTIADERVRGKTMKIRCKKCQHLITVGESKRTSSSVAATAPDGMAMTAANGPRIDEEQTLLQDLPASASASMSASASASSVQVVSARASARVSVAPAQLDVPWFVSLDGEEVGPLTLAQARDWVATRAGQGEMFCWSEGFDEWMPVEKVSHFRHVASVGTGGDSDNPFASLPKRELRSTAPPPAAEDSGDLDIGEVSRIVNLAELAKADAAKRAKAAAAPAPAAEQAGATANPRRTVMMGAAVALPAASPEQAERAQEAIAESQQKHRRSSLAVLLVAGIFALGAAALIFALATKKTNDDVDTVAEFATETDSLGRRISLPDPTNTKTTPGTKRTPTGGGTRVATSGQGGQSSASTTSGTSGTSTGKPEKVEIGPDGQKITALTADDVISVSAKMQSGTRRCYERAQKEDPFFKAPKIIVRVVIEKTGAVSTVTLDKAGGTSFGACLVSAIKRWPFRVSTEGLTIDLPLVFGQS